MKKINYTAALFIIVSILLQLYLARQFYQVNYGYSVGESICNINEVLNCDAVASSSYSKIFGIPNAISGLFLNLLLLICLMGSLTEESKNGKWNKLFYVLSLLSFIASIGLAFISLVLLKKICIFCFSLYVLALGIFIIAHLYKRPSSLLSLDFFKDKMPLSLLLSIPLLSLITHQIVKNEYSPKKMEKEIVAVVRDWKNSTKYEIGQSSPMFSLNPSGEYEIVEFADFLCPHCATAHLNLKSFFKLHKNIKFSFYAFPLDASCNKAMDAKYAGPGYSCTLAKGVYCAAKINKGYQLYSYIFENQNQFKKTAFSSKNDGLIKTMQKQLEESERSSFKLCVESSEAQEALLSQSAAGQSIKVQGTPTLLLEGKKLRGGANFLVLKKAVESL